MNINGVLYFNRVVKLLLSFKCRLVICIGRGTKNGTFVLETFYCLYLTDYSVFQHGTIVLSGLMSRFKALCSA